MTPLELALVCWLVACVIAGTLQLVAPRFVARHSAWSVVPGWQREIALWNFALCVGIFYVLYTHAVAGQLVVSAMIVSLSLLLAINHLAALRAGRAATHALGIAANVVGFALVTWGLCTR